MSRSDNPCDLNVSPSHHLYTPKDLLRPSLSRYDNLSMIAQMYDQSQSRNQMPCISEMKKPINFQCKFLNSLPNKNCPV